MKLFSGLLFIVNFAASIHAEQIKLTLKHSMPELNLENLASLEHYGKRGALDEGLVNYGTNITPVINGKEKEFDWIYTPGTKIAFKITAPAVKPPQRKVFTVRDWNSGIVFSRKLSNKENSILFKPDVKGFGSWMMTVDIYKDNTPESLQSRLFRNFSVIPDASSKRNLWKQENDYILGSCYFPIRNYNWAPYFNPKLSPAQVTDKICDLAARAGLTLLRTDHFEGNVVKNHAPNWKEMNEVMGIMAKHSINADLKTRIYPKLFKGETLEINHTVFDEWNRRFEYLLKQMVPKYSNIQMMEIGNEPAHHTFWGGTRKQYQWLLDYQTKRIKKLYPEMIVLHGGTCEAGADLGGTRLKDPEKYIKLRDAQEKWYENFYKECASRQEYTAYHFHGPLSKQKIDWRNWEEDLLKKSGPKSIKLLQTEGGACAWNPELETVQWKHNLKKMFWSWSRGEKGWIHYQFSSRYKEKRLYSGSVNGWSMINGRYFTPRFQFGTHAALVYLFAGCKPLKILSAPGKTGQAVYLFKHPNGIMVVAYTLSGEAEIKLKSDAAKSIEFDVMGNMVNQCSGSSEYHLTDIPKYLLFKNASNVKLDK